MEKIKIEFEVTLQELSDLADHESYAKDYFADIFTEKVNEVEEELIDRIIEEISTSTFAQLSDYFKMVSDIDNFDFLYFIKNFKKRVIGEE
jgi:thiaminase